MGDAPDMVEQSAFLTCRPGRGGELFPYVEKQDSRDLGSLLAALVQGGPKSSLSVDRVGTHAPACMKNQSVPGLTKNCSTAMTEGSGNSTKWTF